MHKMPKRRCLPPDDGRLSSYKPAIKSVIRSVIGQAETIAVFDRAIALAARLETRIRPDGIRVRRSNIDAVSGRAAAKAAYGAQPYGGWNCWEQPRQIIDVPDA